MTAVTQRDPPPPQNPLTTYRDAIALDWLQRVQLLGGDFEATEPGRLLMRLNQALDAIEHAYALPADDLAERFLQGLELAIEQNRLSVADVVHGLLACIDTFDAIFPNDVRYTPEVIAGERQVRWMLGRFAASAVDIVTERGKIEVERQRESRSRVLALQRVGSAVAGSLDLTDTLSTVVREAAGLMNGATVRLRLADQSGEHLKLIAAAGQDAQPPESVPIESTLAGLCYRSGRPVISNDLTTDPRHDPTYVTTTMQSLLSVPLKSRGQPIGVLSITGSGDTTFQDADAELMTLFADHAAVAIENSRLFQQTQDQLTEVEIVNRVSSVVSATLDVAEIYRAMHAEIARIMEADAFLLFLCNDDDGVDLEYIVDQGQRFAQRHDAPIPQVYVDAMDEHRPYIVDVAAMEEFSAWQRYGDMSRTVQSLIVAPLMRGNEAMGVLSVQSYAHDAYRQRDADLLATLANVASVAIENARLYEQAQRLAIAEERNRLAREIHDPIAQGPVGILLQLEAGLVMVQDDGRLRRRLNRDVELSRVNLDEARRSVRDLRAAPLEHLTLAEAISELAVDHGREHQISVQVTTPDAVPQLDRQAESTLFRFVQEALTNCQKHAIGSRIIIEMHIGDAVTLTVRDDGPGFDVQLWRSTPPTHSFGLHGMRERAERLGGMFHIESEHGLGTTLIMRVPVAVPGSPSNAL